MSAGLILWLVFSPIAAVMAYFITYAEYSRHFPDRGPAIREAARAALYTLVLFLALGAALAFMLPKVTR